MPTLWLEIVKNLGLLVAFSLLLWAPLGVRLLGRLGARNPAMSTSVAIALGMGAWGFVVLAMGLVGVLYSLFVTGVIIVLFFSLELHRHWKLLISKSGSPSMVWLTFPFLLVSFVYFLMVLASSLAPELSFDALNVHLPYARESAATHRIAFAPNNWSSVMPALPLMSYVTAFLFSEQELAKLFNSLCFFLCGGVIHFFARRWWGPLQAIVAAALFWSSPLALYEATTALIDLPLTLYSAIATFSLLEWTRNEDRSFLWLSAVSLGLALGCKYHGAFWILPVGAVLVWHQHRSLNRNWRACFSTTFCYWMIVGALFLPWAVRAWYYTGNPVFPAVNQIFQSSYFTPAMQNAALAMYANEGVGCSLTSLVKLPWTVSFQPGPFRGTVGAFFLPGVVLALLRRKKLAVRYALLLSGTYFYFWAFTAQEIRYLLPLTPILSVLASLGYLGSSPTPLSDPLDREGRGKVFTSRAAALAGIVVALSGSIMSFPSIYSRWVKEWTYWHGYKSPLGYLFGKESRQEYLQRDVPSIYVYDFINRNLSPKNRILLLNDASQYYSQIPTLYSFTLEGEEILLQETKEGVLRKLEESRITHVLLNYNGIAPLAGVAPRKGVYFFLDKEFQGKYLESIYSKNNVVLYRVQNL